MKFKRYVKTVSAAIALAFASAAQADVVFQFDNVSSASIGVPPLGSVTLHQFSANQVDVTVALDPFGSTRFIDTGGPHDAFAYNLEGLGTNFSILNLLPVWMTAIAPANDTPYGVYTNGVQCAACGPGASNSDPLGLGPITFSVFDPDGISFNNFVQNTAGFYFAADVIGPNGGTGSIAADTGVFPPPPPPPPRTVPEPDSLALVGFAMMGVAGFAARKKLLPKEDVKS